MKYDISTLKLLRKYIAADLFRYMTSTSAKAFVRGWYIAGFRYTFFMRCCKYFSCKGPLLKPIFLIFRITLRHYSIKYGFQIPYQTDIGPGLCIGHYGPIIVNPNSIIGINCNITVGVLLGLNHKLDENNLVRFEYPKVGNNVALCNNSKIIGGITIGSNSIIGVNSVVTKDIPNNSIAVGSPAKVISTKGSESLVGSFHPWTLKTAYL